MVSLYFAIMLLPALALIGISKASPSSDLSATLLDKFDSKFLRGLSALFVVVAHYFYFMNDLGLSISKPIYFLVEQLGGIGVLLFFMVSGYGVYASYKEKKPEISFLIKRIKGVYIPYIVIKFAFLLANLILGKDIDIFKSIVNILLVEDWFIHVILIKYILFFAFWKFDKKLFFIFTLIADVVLTVIYILTDKPIGWFNALWLFTFGMLIYEFRNKINAFYSSKTILKASVFLLLFLVTGFVFACFKGASWANVIKPLSGIFLSIFIVGIFKIFKFSSGPLRAIGDRSLYLYIVHLGVWNILGIENLIIRFWCSILLTIVVVEVLYRIVNLFLGRKKAVN